MTFGLNSKSALFLFVTGVPALTASVASFKAVNWTHSEIHGFFTKVKLFIKGSELFSKLSSFNSSNSSVGLNHQYSIKQISHLISTNSQEKDLSLVAEVPLNKMGQFKHYKYCIPKNSLLYKSGAQISNATAGGAEECKLDYLNYHSEKHSTEEITFLLDAITKFIELQHAANILVFYDPETKYNDPVFSNGGGKHSNIIQKTCKLSTGGPKELINDLFFDPKTSTKDCFLSPFSAKISLDISLASKVNGKADSRIVTKITKEQLQQGSMSGSLRYGIFNYYSKLKKFQVNHDSSTKHFSLNLNWPLTFYLNPFNKNICHVDSLLKKIRERDLKLETIKEKCLTFI